MPTTQTLPDPALKDHSPARRHHRRRHLIASAVLVVACAGGIVAKSSLHSSGAPTLQPPPATTLSGLDAPRDGIDTSLAPAGTTDTSSQVANVDPAFAGGTGD